MHSDLPGFEQRTHWSPVIHSDLSGFEPRTHWSPVIHSDLSGFEPRTHWSPVIQSDLPEFEPRTHWSPVIHSDLSGFEPRTHWSPVIQSDLPGFKPMTHLSPVMRYNHEQHVPTLTTVSVTTNRIITSSNYYQFEHIFFDCAAKTSWEYVLGVLTVVCCASVRHGTTYPQCCTRCVEDEMALSKN